jgi:hypothetical protein
VDFNEKINFRMLFVPLFFFFCSPFSSNRWIFWLRDFSRDSISQVADLIFPSSVQNSLVRIGSRGAPVLPASILPLVLVLVTQARFTSSWCAQGRLARESYRPPVYPSCFLIHRESPFFYRSNFPVQIPRPAHQVKVLVFATSVLFLLTSLRA